MTPEQNREIDEFKKRLIRQVAIGGGIGLIATIGSIFFLRSPVETFTPPADRTKCYDADDISPEGYYKVIVACKPDSKVRFRWLNLDGKDYTRCLNKPGDGAENELGFVTYLDTAGIDLFIVNADLRSQNANTNKFKFTAKLLAPDGKPIDSIVVSKKIIGTTRSVIVYDTLQFNIKMPAPLITRNP